MRQVLFSSSGKTLMASGAQNTTLFWYLLDEPTPTLDKP
jgi:hypothetical protein